MGGGMTLIFIAAMYCFALASYGIFRADQNLGTQPQPQYEVACYLCGGPVSLIGSVGLLVGGFMHFSLWSTPVSIFCLSLYAAGYTYGRFPIGASYALMGCVVGAPLALVWFVIGAYQ
jgi:hypothetical protein